MQAKTLYEVLEVSENASAEVIEKAYKVLAKKYHPDLQQQEEKQKAEKKMKEINEAYEILGNEEKRKEYDQKLQQEREEKIKNNQNQNNVYTTNSYTGYSPFHAENVSNNTTTNMDYERERIKAEKKLQKEQEMQRKKMEENLNKEYENAYYNYLRSLGYKVKHSWTKESIKDFFIVLLIMAVIITILWFIPPTHDWMVNFYEQNPILKVIIDIIVSIVTGIFQGIWSFITGLFS